MRRRGAMVLMVAIAACAALAFPGSASAFQNITLENGGTTLHIVGDAGKSSDLVTIAYDPARDEYVIGHDILTAPAGCRFEGGGPPYKVLRCPARDILFIVIDLGVDKDAFQMTDMVATMITRNLNDRGIWIPLDLLDVTLNMGSGNDKYVETGVQQPTLPAAPTLHPASRKIDMGGGNDAATVGPGDTAIVFGDGSGKLTAGDGQIRATFGDGNSKVEFGDGGGWVKLGDGNSQVRAGAGAVRAVFGSGSSIFTGGSGNDVAKLGPGNDTGSGGPGRDTLFGGPGKDHLYGGPAFDLLNGGAGFDRCYGQAGGAHPISCDVGYQYSPWG